MANKKLLYIINQYPAISHTFIEGEIRGLETLGFEIDRLSFNTPDRPIEALSLAEKSEAALTTCLKQELKDRPHIYLLFALLHPIRSIAALRTALKMGKKANKRAKHFGYFLAALVAGKIASDSKPDLIHAHFSTQACSIALLASRLSKVGYSVTVHGPDEFYDVEANNLKEKYSNADAIITISEFAKSQVLKQLELSQWDKVFVNHLGVDVDKFAPQPKTAQPGPLNVLCVGRLVNAKGQGVLLRALEIIDSLETDVSVTLVGDGPDREQLEEYAAMRALPATFVGIINSDELPDVIAETDLFVLPSFAEGIPIVLMEAMAMGVPCITTHITGIPELITDGLDGLLVPAGSAEQLATAIKKMHDDPAIRRNLGHEAITTINNSWQIKSSNERLAELFVKLTRGL